MSKAVKDGNLPAFMSEQSKIEYDETMEKKIPWMTKNLHKMMLGFSIVWFTIVFIYITKYFGWSNLFLMMPDEFGGFLAGVTLPLAIIWVIMAYIDRGTTFKNEARYLRAYMNQIVYPEDGAATTAKTITDAIRTEIVKLQQIMSEANEKTENIKLDLTDKVEEFSKLLTMLDRYSGKAVGASADLARQLGKNFEEICDKANSSTSLFKGYTDSFSAFSQELKTNTKDIFDKLLPNIKEMKATTDLLQDISAENSSKILQANKDLGSFAGSVAEQMDSIVGVISHQTSKLQTVSDGVMNHCENMQQNLDGSVDKIGKLLKEQNGTVLEQIGMLDKKSETLSKKFAEYGKEIEMEIGKVSTRADLIEERISMQVQSLTGVSDKISGNLSGLENSLNNRISNLSEQNLHINESLNLTVANLLEKSEVLAKLSDDATRQGQVLSAELASRIEAAKNSSNGIMNMMQNMQDSVMHKIGDISERTQTCIAEFSNINDMVQKYATALSESSAVATAQSQVSEASLAQQHKLIADSLNVLDSSKAEIRHQIEDLSRAAQMINEEAGTAINNLKAQMDQALSYSENVVQRTETMSNNLQFQSKNFSDVTNQNMDKLAKFDGTLNEHYTKIGNVTDMVEKRSNDIAQILQKQSDLVGKTTADSNAHFKNVLDVFERQTVDLNRVAKDTSEYVNGVIQGLDDKAQAINLLFKQQENEFFDVCDKIAENTQTISGSLKQQVSVVEQSADRVFARMTLLEEDINKHAENVVASSMASIEKLAGMDKSVHEGNAKLENLVNNINTQIESSSQKFKDAFGAFSNIVADVKKQASSASEVLLDNVSKLQNSNSSLAKESKNTANLMENQIKNIDVIMAKELARAEQIADTFNHQKESLTDIVNIVSTQSRLGEAAMAQQYKILSDTSVEVIAKLNDVTGRFKDNNNLMIENATKVAYELDVLGDKLLKVGEDVVKSSKASITEAAKVSISLGQCGDDMTSTVNASVTKINNAVKDYEGYIANFNTVTAEASSGVFEINNMITSQSNQMLHISEDTKELVKYFNTILNDTSVELSNRAKDAFNQVKSLSKDLKELSLQLDEASKMTEQRLTNSGDKLRSVIVEISANAERISNDIVSSSEVFLKQSGLLDATTDATINKVNVMLDQMETSALALSAKGEDVENRAQKFGEVVESQVKALTGSTDKAEQQLKDIKERYQALQADGFLTEAAKIIEKLESASVDINRIFNPNAEEELWKKYYNGDTSAFVRYLSKNLTKPQVLSIKKEFEKNTEFRDVVNRYIADFEALVTRAQGVDKAEILLSVISGADIGKIYYILAKALGKLQ